MPILDLHAHAPTSGAIRGRIFGELPPDRGRGSTAAERQRYEQEAEQQASAKLSGAKRTSNRSGGEIKYPITKEDRVHALGVKEGYVGSFEAARRLHPAVVAAGWVYLSTVELTWDQFFDKLKDYARFNDPFFLRAISDVPGRPPQGYGGTWLKVESKPGEWYKLGRSQETPDAQEARIIHAIDRAKDGLRNGLDEDPLLTEEGVQVAPNTKMTDIAEDWFRTLAGRLTDTSFYTDADGGTAASMGVVCGGAFEMFVEAMLAARDRTEYPDDYFFDDEDWRYLYDYGYAEEGGNLAEGFTYPEIFQRLWVRDQTTTEGGKRETVEGSELAVYQAEQKQRLQRLEAWEKRKAGDYTLHDQGERGGLQYVRQVPRDDYNKNYIGRKLKPKTYVEESEGEGEEAEEEVVSAEENTDDEEAKEGSKHSTVYPWGPWTKSHNYARRSDGGRAMRTREGQAYRPGFAPGGEGGETRVVPPEEVIQLREEEYELQRQLRWLEAELENRQRELHAETNRRDKDLRTFAEDEDEAETRARWFVHIERAAARVHDARRLLGVYRQEWERFQARARAAIHGWTPSEWKKALPPRKDGLPPKPIDYDKSDDDDDDSGGGDVPRRRLDDPTKRWGESGQYWFMRHPQPRAGDDGKTLPFLPKAARPPPADPGQPMRPREERWATVRRSQVLSEDWRGKFKPQPRAAVRPNDAPPAGSPPETSDFDEAAYATAEARRQGLITWQQQDEYTAFSALMLSEFKREGLTFASLSEKLSEIHKRWGDQQYRAMLDRWRGPTASDGSWVDRDGELHPGPPPRKEAAAPFGKRDARRMYAEAIEKVQRAEAASEQARRDAEEAMRKAEMAQRVDGSRLDPHRVNGDAAYAAEQAVEHEFIEEKDRSAFTAFSVLMLYQFESEGRAFFGEPSEKLNEIGRRWREARYRAMLAPWQLAMREVREARERKKAADAAAERARQEAERWWKWGY